MVAGIPCTTLGRTLADLGSVVHDRRRVSQALTDARRRHVDLRALRATAERLHRPGQSGTGTLLRLLDAVPKEGRVPESWFEELLARCLDSPHLPPLVRQHPILDSTGRVVARVDLAFPAVKLGLEAHSRAFHFGPVYEPLDEDRDLAVAACGWELLYLGWYATQHPADVLRRVEEVVRARKCELVAADHPLPEVTVRRRWSGLAPTSAQRSVALTGPSTLARTTPSPSATTSVGTASMW